MPTRTGIRHDAAKMSNEGRDDLPVGECLTALRQSLMERGFLHTSDGHDLRTRSGAPMPWILYSPAVTLTPEGLTASASVILDRLRGFRSTQLATYGLSALPLLGACVAMAGGRYKGLIIRREVKPYGAGRRIDGPLERDRPVVLIDDAISSGTAMRDGIRALEEQGIEVEGAVALVDFGAGVTEWLSAAGYRVVTALNVWRDLNVPRSAAAGAAESAEPPWTAPLPDGLSPAEVARRVAVMVRSSGQVPRPPSALDAEYPNCGGVFVSVRRRSDDLRLVRAGLAEVAAAATASVADAVVRAAHKVAASATLAAVDDLNDVKFAVSLLGPATPIQVCDIRHRDTALAARSIDGFDRHGFALPNAPHYDDEIQQLRYARSRFWRTEACALVSHSVQRSVEAGANWPEYGAPMPQPHWRDDQRLSEFLGRQVRLTLASKGEEAATILAEDAFPALKAVVAVGVSLYSGGLIGCAVRSGSDVGAMLSAALTAALADRRYVNDIDNDIDIERCEAVTTVVSLLYQPRRLGSIPDRRLHLYFRMGRDTLEARGEGRRGLVLGQFAAQQGLDVDAYRAQVKRKAGLSGETAEWTAYETTSWVVSDRGCGRMEYGLPIRNLFDADDTTRCRQLADEIAAYVIRMRARDGLPAYTFHAWTGRDSATGPGTSTRILLAAGGLLECAPHLDPTVDDAAADIVATFLHKDGPGAPRDNLVWDSGSDAQLLRCLHQLPASDQNRIASDALVRRLSALIRGDGAIYAPGPSRLAADLDLLSGLVVLALSRAATADPTSVAGIDLSVSLDFYRRRFALVSPWRMVWWHSQAWLAAPIPGAQEFGFALVDWALQRQSGHSGAFVIEDVAPYRNSFLTACVLEGVADAWRTAVEIGDVERAARYADAWQRGISFVERLVVRPGDEFFIPGGERARGGVRPTLVSSNLRIDYAGHALLALGKGLSATRQDRTNE